MVDAICYCQSNTGVTLSVLNNCSSVRWYSTKTSLWQLINQFWIPHSEYMFLHYSTLYCNFILISQLYVVDCPCPPPPPTQPHLHMWNSCIVFCFCFPVICLDIFCSAYRDDEVKRNPHSYLPKRAQRDWKAWCILHWKC